MMVFVFCNSTLQLFTEEKNMFISFFQFLSESFKYSLPLNFLGAAQVTVYTGKELEYAFFVHSLCVLGKVLIYTHGRKLFPIKAVKHKGKKLNCKR